MPLEWDEEKRTANLSKHGLDFADAPSVFQSPQRRWLDTREDYGEDPGVVLACCKAALSCWSTPSVLLTWSVFFHCERRHVISEPNMTDASKTDWARDEDIDLSDSPELGATFFVNAIPTMGHPRQVMVTLDPDVFRFVAAQGTEYERLINIALRAYMATQQHG